MDVVSTTIVSSFAGATLFFVGGYLLRSLRQGKAAPAAPETAELQTAELETAELERLRRDLSARDRENEQLTRTAERLSETASQLERSRVEAAGLRQRVADLEQAAAERDEETTQVSGQAAALEAARKLDELGQEAERLKAKVAELERQRATAAAEAKGLRSRAAEAERLKARAAEAERLKARAAEAERLKAKVAELERGRARSAAEVGERQEQLRRAEARLEAATAEVKTLEGLKLHASQADALRRENEEQRRQLEQLGQQLEQLREESVPVEEVTALRRKQRDMLIKAQMMQQRVTEMERHADENTLLRQQLVAHEDLELEVEELRRRSRRLEALVFAAGLDPERRQAPGGGAATGGPDDAAELPRGTAMDRRMGELLVNGKSRSAVLADSQGLLLASSGDAAYHEALAVISGMIGQLGDKSSELLPLGGLRRAALIDENGVQLASRLFLSGDQPLALTFVGSEAGAPDPSVEDLVASLAQIMEAGQEG